MIEWREWNSYGHINRIIRVFITESTKNLIANKLISNNINNLLYCAPSNIFNISQKYVYAMLAMRRRRRRLCVTISTSFIVGIIFFWPFLDSLNGEHNSIKMKTKTKMSVRIWMDDIIKWGSTQDNVMMIIIDDVVYSTIVTRKIHWPREVYTRLDELSASMSGKYLQILVTEDFLRYFSHVSLLFFCLLLNYTNSLHILQMTL